MTLNDLANLGQIIGAIAVVISLIYVAFQIRQNTAAIRSATAQTVHEQVAGTSGKNAGISSAMSSADTSKTIS
jgi:hypothetical protein